MARLSAVRQLVLDAGKAPARLRQGVPKPAARALGSNVDVMVNETTHASRHAGPRAGKLLPICNKLLSVAPVSSVKRRATARASIASRLDLLKDKEEMVTTMKNRVLKFLRDERGLTTVEYAVAGGLIALAVVVAFTNLGATVGQVITQINAILP